MGVANATVTQLYDAKGKAATASKAIESITLTGNTSAALRTEVDGLIDAAITSLTVVKNAAPTPPPEG